MVSLTSNPLQAYAIIHFHWSAAQFLWFLLFEFLTLTLFTSVGVAAVVVTPNPVIAYIVTGDTDSQDRSSPCSTDGHLTTTV
jgi:hypothetical protein